MSSLLVVLCGKGCALLMLWCLIRSKLFITRLANLTKAKCMIWFSELESAWSTSYIQCNWTFFSTSYGSDVIRRYWSKSAFFKGGGSGSLSANFRWKGTSPTNLCWYQKTRMITLLCGVKMSTVIFFHFVTMHACDCDRRRQTDRITIPKTALA